MIRPIPQDTRHTVVVRYIDAARRNREVRFADWTPVQATERAWSFTRPRRMTGEILAFRMLHNPESLL
jgi:hypothetical protein